VTGVVALLMQQEPQRRPDQIREILRTTAQPVTPVSPSAPLAIGIVDACAALAGHTPLLACH